MRINQRGAIDMVLVVALVVIVVVGGFVVYRIGNSDDSSSSDSANDSAMMDGQGEDSTESTEMDEQPAEMTKADYQTLYEAAVKDLGIGRKGNVVPASEAYFNGNDKITLNRGAIFTYAYFDGSTWVEITSVGEPPFCTDIEDVPDEYKLDCFDENTELVENFNFDTESRTYTLDVRE